MYIIEGKPHKEKINEKTSEKWTDGIYINVYVLGGHSGSTM